MAAAEQRGYCMGVRARFACGGACTHAEGCHHFLNPAEKKQKDHNGAQTTKMCIHTQGGAWQRLKAL